MILECELHPPKCRHPERYLISPRTGERNIPKAGSIGYRVYFRTIKKQEYIDFMAWWNKNITDYVFYRRCDDFINMNHPSDWFDNLSEYFMSAIIYDRDQAMLVKMLSVSEEDDD